MKKITDSLYNLHIPIPNIPLLATVNFVDPIMTKIRNSDFPDIRKFAV